MAAARSAEEGTGGAFIRLTDGLPGRTGWKGFRWEAADWIVTGQAEGVFY